MENITRIANDFAAKQNVRLPLRLDTLKRLCESLGYTLLTYSNSAKIFEMLQNVESYTKCAAFCARISDCGLVFYDDTRSVGTRLFSVAHEIGHIVLKHIETGALGYDAADTVQEREADAFAYALLAPLRTLRARGVRTVEQIQQETLLDRAQAEHVFAKLQVSAYRRLALLCGGVCIAATAFSIAVFSMLHGVTPVIGKQEPVASPPPVVTQALMPPVASTEIEVTSMSADVSAELLVYMTPHGDCYHKKNCPHIADCEVSTISLSAAVDFGRSPCRTCFRNYD